MSVKLSELNNDDILIVDVSSYCLVISKEDYIKEMKDHEGKEVYTTIEYEANIDAKDMLESAIDCEASNMYEDWGYDVWDDITEEHINELQNVIDRILDEIGKSRNTTYFADKKVEIDI